jgi:hypothetical protein
MKRFIRSNNICRFRCLRHCIFILYENKLFFPEELDFSLLCNSLNSLPNFFSSGWNVWNTTHNRDPMHAFLTLDLCFLFRRSYTIAFTEAVFLSCIHVLINFIPNLKFTRLKHLWDKMWHFGMVWDSINGNLWNFCKI